MKFPKVVVDLFTGPDGVTWAIGRIYSLPTLVSGLALPFVALIQQQKIDFSAIGVMYGGLGACVMAMVAGTNFTEPKAGPNETV